VPLRTGAARMIARAHAAGAKGLTFQAVGLEFDARDTFRSRAAVIYGPVRSVDELGLAGEPLVHAITDRIRADLSELIVEGETWDDRLLVARVAELFANEQGKRSLAGWNEIGRQVEAARRALIDEPLYRELAEQVTRYYEALESAGLRDADVVRDKAPPAPWKKRLLLFAALPLAIPGALLYFVPYQLPRLVTGGMKEKNRDEVSTYKLATGLVVYPIWAAGLIAGSLILLPPPLSWLATAGVVASPFAALLWLDHLEHGPRRAPATLQELEEMRGVLMRALHSARERLAA
jgi:hypothetical protein